MTRIYPLTFILALFLPFQASALEVRFTDAGPQVRGMHVVEQAEKKAGRVLQRRPVLASANLPSAAYSPGGRLASSSAFNRSETYFGNVSARRSTFSYARDNMRTNAGRPVRPFLSSGFRAASYSFRQSALRSSGRLGRASGRAVGRGRF